MPNHFTIHRLGCFLLCGFLLAGCAGFGAADRYRRQAEEFFAEGRLAEAVLTYRQALQTDPDNPDLLGGLGKVLAAQGRNRSAARVLAPAAEQRPEDGSLSGTLSKLFTRPQDGLSLHLVWIVDLAADEPVGAAAAAGKIFVVYADGRLLALEQDSGGVLWDTSADAALTSPPAADGAQVWVGAEDGRILVFNAADGKPLGAFSTGAAVYAAPALTPELAYCPSGDGSLYALSRTGMELQWKAAIGEPLHASPLVAGGAVYVGANDGRLYALDASTGERIWKNGIPTQGAVESIPAEAYGWIFFGSDDGRVYALDAATGGEYWRFSTPDAVFAQPLVIGDQLLAASSGRVLASLRLWDGAVDWSLSFDHPLTETPALYKEVVYLVTGGDPRLFAVDLHTGTLIGDLHTGDWIARGPLAADAGLFFLGKDGAVFLYR